MAECIAQEVGRTVRAALTGWPETLRLCLILIAATILISVLLVVAA